MDEGELRLTLTEFVRSSDRCPNGVLLIVDEAHTLPTRLLEEIRLLTNQVHHDRPSIRLVLVGTTSLEERLATAPFDSLNQRIVSRCYLEAFNSHETHEYVGHQLAVADDSTLPSFDESALAATYTATGGVARLINQLCDHVVLLAQADGIADANSKLVEEAWSDLQQLPAPWHSEQTTGEDAEGDSTVIEFGELDDEADILEPLPDPDGKSDLSIDLYEPELTSRINPLLDPDETTGEFANSMVLPIAELGGGIDLEDPHSSDEVPPADHSSNLTTGEEGVDSVEEVIDNQEDDQLEQPAQSATPVATRPFDPNDPFAEEFEDESIVENTYASAQEIHAWNAAHAGSKDPEQDAEFEAAIADLNAFPTVDDSPSFPFAVTVTETDVELDSLENQESTQIVTIEDEAHDSNAISNESPEAESKDAISGDGLVPLSTYLEEQRGSTESETSTDESIEFEINSEGDDQSRIEEPSSQADSESGPVDVSRFPAIGNEFISSGDVNLDTLDQDLTIEANESTEEEEPTPQMPLIDDASWPVTHSDHLMQASTLVSGIPSEPLNENTMLDAFDEAGEMEPVELNLGISKESVEEQTQPETAFEGEPVAEASAFDPSRDADDGLGEQILREIVAFRDVADFDPSTDPVMPEFRPAGSESELENVATESSSVEEGTAASVEETGDTSRPDIVIVEALPDVLSNISEAPSEPEPEAGFQAEEPPGNAHREDYRSLFDRLKG